MKITTQDGQVVHAHTIEVGSNVIRYTPDEDHRRKIVCGTYKDRCRATEVFSEMAETGWTQKNPEYVMPKE